MQNSLEQSQAPLQKKYSEMRDRVLETSESNNDFDAAKLLARLVPYRKFGQQAAGLRPKAKVCTTIYVGASSFCFSAATRCRLGTAISPTSCKPAQALRNAGSPFQKTPVARLRPRMRDLLQGKNIRGRFGNK